MQNLLKQVDRSFSAFQRTLPDRRRFQSAGLAETMTVAHFPKFAGTSAFSQTLHRSINRYYTLSYIFYSKSAKNRR